MSDLPVAARRYTDREVARLLRRATELQNETRPVGNLAGLTLAELEAAAAEVGIDPALLRQAAQELESAGPGLGRKLAGAPLRIVRERSLPFEADGAALDQLLPVIQVGAGGPGHFSHIGRTLSWCLDDDSVRSLEVLVSAGRGRTLIRIEERFGSFAAGLFGGVVGGVGGLGLGATVAVASVEGMSLLLGGLPVAALAIPYLSCRAGFRARVRRRERALDQLLAGLEVALRELSVAASPPASG